MARPPRGFVDVARRYVCVRVTDMRHVDLNRYRFDFDLTFAVLLANPDGTIYHRYGGRPNEDPLAWMSLDSLTALLRATLDDHAAYQAGPTPPELRPARTIADLPPFAKKLREQAIDCVHCHTVHEAERDWRQEQGTWRSADDVWVWPAPARIGLELDAGDQAVVRTVAEGSAAHAAGLRPGDRLVRLGAQHVRTIHDVQWVLENAAATPNELAVAWTRGADEHRATLALPDGWKRTTPRDYAWRPFKWGLDPGPGFGGRELSRAEKRALGLPEGGLAFRVGYLVTWGPKARTGQNAERAGIRKGDVVFSVGGRSDFDSVQHFHAWVRLTRRPGEKVEIRLLRDGRERRVELTLVE